MKLNSIFFSKKVVWLENGGENGDYVYNIGAGRKILINPNGNTWTRMNFDRAYMLTALYHHWQSPNYKMNARAISKMMQDHYRFLISENKDEYDVSIKTLLDLTLFVKGQDEKYHVGLKKSQRNILHRCEKLAKYFSSPLKLGVIYHVAWKRIVIYYFAS